MTVLLCVSLLAPSCANGLPEDRVRASGYVEATEVRVAPQVGGRILQLAAAEGDRVEQGQLVARLDTVDVELAIERATAERRQAIAQLRLLEAGTRVEDIRQAEADVRTAGAELDATRAELASASQDLTRFEDLLASRSGSEKQRDDAATRRDVARERVQAAEGRVQAARARLAKLEAGTRPQEIEAARARAAVADAQIATLDKARSDATVTAPAAGVVTEQLVNAGEIVSPGTALVVVTDLDRAWVNVFVGEPIVPRLRLGQEATVLTDAGDRVAGTITYVSPRAEFTPRNVQTAEERSRLVYRLKITVDNRAGVLKSGMPVEADIPLTPAVAAR